MRTLPKVFLLTAALALGLAGAGSSQLPLTPPADPAVQDILDTFSDSLDVQGVNVEVVVTDRKGNRVDGLSAADFRLLVDGREIPLEYFVEIREGAAVPPPAPAPDQAAGGTAVPAPPPALQDGEAVGNSYLIFVDELFSPFHLRNEALKALSREVATLRPQDRMALVSFDGRRIKVLSPWAAPGEPLRILLEKLGHQKGGLAAASLTFRDLDPTANTLLSLYEHNAERAFETQSAGPIGRDFDVQSVTSIAPDGDAAPQTASMIDVAMAKRELQLIKKSVAAASASLRAFSAAPGRKVMLLLSGGWRYDQTGANAASWGQVSNFMGLRDGVEMLRPLVDTGNLLGFTVYPVHLSDGPGVLPNAGDRGSSTASGMGAARILSYAVSQGSLVFAADETGGKILLPGRNRHLAKVVADTSSYYWLGFTHSGDDRRHGLKVELRRPGLKVRSRSSFVPLSREARVAMEVESALLTGQAPGMTELGVTLGEARRLGNQRMELPVTLRIPADQLALVPQSGRHVGRLELRIGSLDEYGDRSDVPVLPIQIAEDKAPQPGSFIRYDTTLRLRDSPQDLQLIVYDLVGGKSFAERVRVEPPK
ncbi:MAG TPA: VWA domain-containing protein [Thermoanaerobaculia bacterium]|nr:VWA domain-containing protein [Thermoanaerobaculia bacterium]